MTTPTILVVDDKLNLVRLLVATLSRSARVLPAGSVREAVAALDRERIDLVICDLKMPDGSGLEVLRASKRVAPSAPFILMTAYASVATAVQAMHEGAYDYVTKPFDPEDVHKLTVRALAPWRLAQLDGSGAPSRMGSLLGECPAMRDVFQKLRRLAPSPSSVLLLGERGTGKSSAAQAIHDEAGSIGPLLTILCAEPTSVAELAALLRSPTGQPATLFLSGVADLPRESQLLLARHLDQPRPVAPRIVASAVASADLGAPSFDPKLFLLLSTSAIELPALRERGDDISLLAAHFLTESAATRASAPMTFAPDVLALLGSYPWPGNVRELRSVIAKASLEESSTIVRRSSLPSEIRGTTSKEGEDLLVRMSLGDAVESTRIETNRRYLETVLRKFQGDVSAAANHAGLERESFYRLLRRYGIVASSFRGSDPK